MNSKVVLDASALLALILQENGAEIVRPLIKNAIMSSVNIAEVLTALLRLELQPHEALSSINDIISTIIPFNVKQAQRVAELYPFVKQKGLSLGDRACIALGIELQAPVYTADRIWSELKLENTQIKLIR